MFIQATTSNITIQLVYVLKHFRGRPYWHFMDVVDKQIQQPRQHSLPKLSNLRLLVLLHENLTTLTIFRQV